MPAAFSIELANVREQAMCCHIDLSLELRDSIAYGEKLSIRITLVFARVHTSL